MENYPQISHEQKLEKRSFNRIKTLLEDTDLFEVGQNDFYDYGIDFEIELNIKGRYVTNHRVQAQLKAIDKLEKKAKKKDNSYSIQIYSSNVNYLLSGMLSIYILYVKSENQFYYEWTSDAFSKISEKDPDWLSKKKKRTVNFRKLLNEEILPEIHEYSLIRLKAFKEFRIEQIRLSNSASKTSSKMILDADNLTVSSDESAIQQLKEFGIDLINQGYAKKVLDLINQHTKQIEKSDKIRFIIGLANFHIGNFYASLHALKSIADNSDLESYNLDYARFLFFHIKKALNLINEETFQAKLIGLDHSPIIKAYSDLVYQKKKFLQAPKDFYDEYVDTLQRIASDFKDFETISLQARIDLLFAMGWLFQQKMELEIIHINSIEAAHNRVLPEVREQSVISVISLFDKWLEISRKLRKDILANNNQIIFALYAQIDINLKIRTSVDCKVIELPQIPEFETSADGSFDALIALIDQAIEINKHYSQNYNLCVCLATKFEVLEFYNQENETIKVLDEIFAIAHEYDFQDILTKTEKLKAGNTYYSKKKERKQGFQRKREEDRKRMESAYKLFGNIHEQEEEIIRKQQEPEDISGYMVINLFKVGFYKIEKERLDSFFTLLEIDPTSDLAKNIEHIGYKVKAIPVLNIIPKDILVGGYGEGSAPQKPIEDLERWVYRKKLLFESGFKRIRDSY